MHLVEQTASFVWNGIFLPFVFIGGIYFTLQSRFLQVVKLPRILRETLGRMFQKGEREQGSVTPFQALCTALAGTVGTGSVVGTCQALAMGGPGALFWLMAAAFLGMIIKFYEVTLSVAYRQRSKTGEWVGGPMYYLAALGRGGKALGLLFALFATLASFGMGNLAQAGSIAHGVKRILATVSSSALTEGKGEWLLAVLLFVILSVCIFGGMGRVGKVAELLVPFMSLFYLLLCLAVLFCHGERLGQALKSVFACAFRPKALLGAASGIGMKQALEWGLKRSAFSNEAGLGSAGIAHAAAQTKHPVQQGFFGVFEVFVDTVLISSLTGLVVLVSLPLPQILSHSEPDAFLITEAFSTVLPPAFSVFFVSISLILFAFSTLLGWSLYGQRCAQYLLGEGAAFGYRLIFVTLAALGVLLPTRPVWALSDLFNGLMAIPNFVGLFFLSSTVKAATASFFRKKPSPRKKKI